MAEQDPRWVIQTTTDVLERLQDLYFGDPGSRLSIEQTFECRPDGQLVFVSLQVTYFASKDPDASA